MRRRSSGSLISTRPGRAVATSARSDDGRDRGAFAAEAHGERAGGLARGKLADLHAVHRAVRIALDHARVVAGGSKRLAQRLGLRAYAIGGDLHGKAAR